MQTGNVIASTILGLILGFLAVESYRTAPAEHEGLYDGPTIHWGKR